MPVRGTTQWQHAILSKKVINLDHAGDRHVMCAWDDCEKDGFENNKVVINYGRDRGPNAHFVTHVFCSEKHRWYFINFKRYGYAPKGMRNSLQLGLTLLAARAYNASRATPVNELGVALFVYGVAPGKSLTNSENRWNTSNWVSTFGCRCLSWVPCGASFRITLLRRAIPTFNTWAAQWLSSIRRIPHGE